MNKKTAQGLPDFLEEIGRGMRWPQQWPPNYHVLLSPASPNSVRPPHIRSLDATTCIRKVQNTRTLIGVAMTPWPWTATWHIAFASSSMTARLALMSPALVHRNITSTFWHGARHGFAHESIPTNIPCYTWLETVHVCLTVDSKHHSVRGIASLWSCNHICGSPHRITLCQPPSRTNCKIQSEQESPAHCLWLKRWLTGCGIFTATSACSPGVLTVWLCHIAFTHLVML